MHVQETLRTLQWSFGQIQVGQLGGCTGGNPDSEYKCGNFVNDLWLGNMESSNAFKEKHDMSWLWQAKVW